MTAAAPLTDRFTLTRLAGQVDVHAQLASDVLDGLTATPRTLPARWFYDARGSALFERITHLTEYYQTRTEAEILTRVVDEVAARVAPCEVVELGSGSSRKTRLLLEAMHRAGTGDRYVAFDVSEDAVRAAAVALTADYPWLTVTGVVGDFERHLGLLPRGGRGVVAFLGSTIGNLERPAQAAFVEVVANGLGPDDALLLGVDLAPGEHKSVASLEAAYDDAEGVTAAFNRNVLAVLRRELGAVLDPEDFEHVARWVPGEARIEMWLRARRDLVLRVDRIDLAVPFAAGEGVRTEISCKFTRADVEGLFAHAGLTLARWDTDPHERFALAMGTRN